MKQGCCILTLSIAAAALLLAAPAYAKPKPTPVIFVHGSSGSAQQFETNAMRLTSNGFPQGRIFVYEYSTLEATNDLAVANLDGFIAAVKQRTGASQVDILAHSRGTTVMHTYLGTPERAASVRRYVNFDGRTAAGQPGGVPTLAIWGEGDPAREIVGAENVRFPEKAHTEVTTSREAFVSVYRFLTGRKPETKNVIPEKPSKVKVAGRALTFPDNAGIAGGQFDVFEISPRTGARKQGGPIESLVLGPDGSWGPLKLDGRRRYEFAVTRPGAGYTVHNYPEPFERDDHFYRVLDAPLLRPFIESNPSHTSLTVTRMREFWGDQGAAPAVDSLVINGLNVLTPTIAPRARRVLAVFNFDEGSDGVTDTSASLSPFSSLAFLTAVDHYIPASPDASGTVPVANTPRGGKSQTVTTNVPNWPSGEHTVSVYFKDYAAKEYKPSP